MSEIMIQEQIEYGNLQDKFVELLLNAGWENIASNPSEEGAVMHSTGEKGNMKLLFCIEDMNRHNGQGFKAWTSYPHGCIWVDFLSDYVPGASEMSGSKTRLLHPNNNYSDTYGQIGFHLGLGGNSLPLQNDERINIYYKVNRDHIFLVTEPVDMVSGRLSNWVFLGHPSSFTVESGVTGLILASSTRSVYGGTSDYFPDCVFYSGYPKMYNQTNVGRWVVFQNRYLLSSRSPNLSGKFHISDVFTYHSNVGIRSCLDYVYVLPAENIAHGDYLQIGSEKYKIMKVRSGNAVNNSWRISHSQPIDTIAIRVG